MATGKGYPRLIWVEREVTTKLLKETYQGVRRTRKNKKQMPSTYKHLPLKQCREREGQERTPEQQYIYGRLEFEPVYEACLLERERSYRGLEKKNIPTTYSSIQHTTPMKETYCREREEKEMVK